jgi:hypothetical protein
MVDWGGDDNFAREVVSARADLDAANKEITRLHAECDSLRAAVNNMRALNAQLSANAAAKMVETRDEIAHLQRCLNFFASVIKSGEAWSGTCEQEYRAALAPPEGK